MLVSVVKDDITFSDAFGDNSDASDGSTSPEGDASIKIAPDVRAGRNTSSSASANARTKLEL